MGFFKQTGANKFHVDVPKSVRSHLLGENHSAKHKFIFGSLIMCFGISLVKGSYMFESSIVHFFADAVGYLLHGIGALPIVKAVEEGGKS